MNTIYNVAVTVIDAGAEAGAEAGVEVDAVFNPSS